MLNLAEFTIWYGLKLNTDEDKMGDFCEHLAMNGYTYDTNGDDVLFVYHEEIEYVVTILNDLDIEFEII